MSDGTDFDPIAASIDLMRAQIAKLQSAIETLESVRSIVGQTAGSPSGRNGGEVNFGHDAFFGMTASDAAKKFLAATKKTAPPKTIADALVAGGWKTASKNVTENIRTILSRNATFVVINGEVGLAEWYPGRKASKPRNVANAAPSSEEESSDSEDSSSDEESSSESASES